MSEYTQTIEQIITITHLHNGMMCRCANAHTHIITYTQCAIVRLHIVPYAQLHNVTCIQLPIVQSKSYGLTFRYRKRENGFMNVSSTKS
jgi:hypothetical protein